MQMMSQNPAIAQGYQMQQSGMLPPMPGLNGAMPPPQARGYAPSADQSGNPYAPRVSR